jgi:hypothetical protein
MTNEGKLKALLDKAVENGFNNLLYYLNFELLPDKITVFVNRELDYSYQKLEYSLNDLVLNTNFFECLFPTDEKVEYDLNIEEIGNNYKLLKHSFPCLKLCEVKKVIWLLLPVEKRLNWLFKQFNL